MCKWQLFQKINKRVGPNKAMQVRKKSRKRIKNVTLLLGTSEYKELESRFMFLCVSVNKMILCKKKTCIENHCLGFSAHFVKINTYFSYTQFGTYFFAYIAGCSFYLSFTYLPNFQIGMHYIHSTLNFLQREMQVMTKELFFLLFS